MAVAVVEIVNVVAVLHRFMGALAASVRVLGKGVLCPGFLGHNGSFQASHSFWRLMRFPAVAVASRMTWAKYTLLEFRGTGVRGGLN
jgi:hypothetical protein